MLFGWILLIIVGYFLFKTFSGRSGNDPRWLKTTFQGDRTPKEIINERYARGEISREEFHQLQNDLDQ